MELTKAEINVLEQMAMGKTSAKAIAPAVKKGIKQVYVILKRLGEKSFTGHKRKKFELLKSPHVTLLIQLIEKHPEITGLLADSGITVLSALLEPATANEILARTGLKKSIVYRKLRNVQKYSIVAIENRKYTINRKIWADLSGFLEELAMFENTTDKRVPVNSVIYHKKGNEIIFSNRQELDAEKTAFSVYSEYGIKIMPTTNYYCLPKRKLTKKEIMLHSLYITEKEKSMQNIIFVALFYLKHGKKMRIQNPLLENIKLVLEGKAVSGYPTLKEIADRAEIYNIKVILK